MGTLLLLGAVFGVYFLPAIVAGARDSKSAAGVVALNLFLGWTLVGWLVAFVWAFGKTHAEDDLEARRHAEILAAMGVKPTLPPVSMARWSKADRAKYDR